MHFKRQAKIWSNEVVEFKEKPFAFVKQRMVRHFGSNSRGLLHVCIEPIGIWRLASQFGILYA